MATSRTISAKPVATVKAVVMPLTRAAFEAAAPASATARPAAPEPCLCELGSALAAEHEPSEALSLWLRRLAAHTLMYRGLKDVLTADDGDQEENGPADFSWSAARMHATCAELLDRVQAGGQATAQVKAGDLLRLMHGVVVSSAYLREPERTASTDRLLDLILHGLRS